MKEPIVGFLLAAAAGMVAGFAVGLFVAPYLFPAPSVGETITEGGRSTLAASGTFLHADPKDPIHYGSGGVRVYSDMLHLESDFEVGPGPKYHVYLVIDAEVTPDTRVEEGMFVDLGRLKAFSGSQSYPVPAGLDLTDYRTVVIWCEHFNTLISPAPLSF